MTIGPTGTAGPEDLHVLLGAYVLGGLSDEDHRAFSEHLRTCRQCQAELGQVSGIPRLLHLAGPAGGPHLATTQTGAPEPALAEPDDARVARLLREVGRRRRRRRTWFASLSAAAAVLLFVAGGLIGPSIVASNPPTTHVAAAALPGSSVKVDVALVTRGWGTQLDIDCEDMPKNGELLLWVTDHNGNQTPVASWLATPSGYSKVTGATALRPNEITRVEIRTGTGRLLAAAQT
ncbi:zf-HC2 domain-containing protein [Monashia sp. NPDC004114]